MEFITQEYIKEQAQKGEMEALQCSLLHHQQGRDATRGELIDAIESEDFEMSAGFCACCKRYGPVDDCTTKLGQCLLYSDGCCGGIYKPIREEFRAFKNSLTKLLYIAFTEAESKVCDYIQGVIDKKQEKKPELRHGDYGENDNGKMFIILDGVIHWEEDSYPDGQRISPLPNRTIRPELVRGNIFDELKAISEPLTEFRYDHATFTLGKKGVDTGRMFIETDRGDKWWFDLTPDFILNLRRMEATLRSKK